MSHEKNASEMPKVPVRRMPWVRSALLGMAILICGAIIGGVVSAVMLKAPPEHGFGRPERLPQEIADRMREKYRLSEEQTARIRAIFEEHADRFAAIRAEVHPRIEAAHESLRSAVEEVLTPEQTRAWREEFESMRRLWGPRRGGPPPFPKGPPR